MKYILFEDFGGQPVPVIFPNRIGHEEMREQMPYSKVLSAGYVELTGTAFVCHGESKALGAAAGKDDAAIITCSFNEAC